MDYKEKLAKSAELFAEAKRILGDENSTAEDKNKVPEMIQDAQRFKAEGAQLKEIAMSAAELDTAMEDIKKKVPAKTFDDVGEEYNTLGELLLAIRAWTKLGIRDSRMKWYHDLDGKITSFDERKDLAEAVGATGGFLVPAQFIATLYAALAERSFVRPRATIIPMRRRQVTIPVLDQTGTTAGVPHWFGGMTFYWAEEATEKTETDPEFRNINLVAHKLIGYTRASDELVSDSAISLDALLTGELGFVGGANWMEEYAFINGTGAGQPLGIIPAGATITVARAADGAISYPDLCNMMENFLPSGNGIWIITQSALSDLIQISGPAGNPSYVWQPNARESVPGYLFGMPVIFSEKCPRIGSPGDVILADLRYYLIGDRQAATIESTQFDRWRFDQTSWRLVHRVDGMPWLSAPLRLQDGTSEISPFVILGGKST